AVTIDPEVQNLEPQSRRSGPRVTLNELPVQIDSDGRSIERHRNVLEEIRRRTDQPRQLAVAGVQSIVAEAIELDLQRRRMLSGDTRRYDAGELGLQP